MFVAGRGARPRPEARKSPPIWVWPQAVCKAVHGAPNAAFGPGPAQSEEDLVLASGVSAAGATGLAAEQPHVRFFVMVAGGRGEVAELADLRGGQLDAIGGGVLLDSGDALGAGDRGDVVALR